ncbi:MAG: VTT domain-containing protein [Pseudomonadota bacterium]
MISSLLSLPLDQTLTQWLAVYGPWAFGLVALIVFAETGLVVAPFLPGDSLLFVTGAAVGAAGLGVHGVVLLLIAAAVAGDALNFAIGRRAGPWLVARFKGRGLKRNHLALTRAYFRRFGAWTVVVARFVPVVRTLAPFLAGAGRMSYARFAAFNVLGGAVWVASLVYAGAWLGALPFVKSHIGSITIGIVVLSLVPVTLAALRARTRARARPAGA